jgi:hypothetical protein
MYRHIATLFKFGQQYRTLYMRFCNLKWLGEEFPGHSQRSKVKFWRTSQKKSDKIMKTSHLKMEVDPASKLSCRHYQVLAYSKEKWHPGRKEKLTANSPPPERDSCCKINDLYLKWSFVIQKYAPRHKLCIWLLKGNEQRANVDIWKILMFTVRLM